jgi:multiple sugar transport system permease protein/raffinose/stachyose/melibiose transport system permease protein
VFWLIMAGMMVPFQVLIIPLYQQFNTYGLVNTLVAVMLPRLALPIGVFILKQFYEGIPAVLEEAAFIDGAGASGSSSNLSCPWARPPWRP